MHPFDDRYVLWFNDYGEKLAGFRAGFQGQNRAKSASEANTRVAITTTFSQIGRADARKICVGQVVV